MPLSTRRIPFEIQVPENHPELLKGLDFWLQLGLISDREVREWAKRYLVSPVPEFIETKAQPMSSQGRSQGRTSGDFLSDSVRSSTEQTLLTRLLSGFMAELGVMWLLFLGVFLVVVSSAVLASLQWHNVSPIGQYGILCLYTLAFGSAAGWTAQNSHLRHTHQMLKAVTLLIIPVNFWMMDGFGLWRSSLGIIVSLIAGLLLLGMQFFLLRSSTRFQANYIGLSLLHWGWFLPGIPVVSVYVGTIGTALIQVLRSVISSDSALAQGRSPVNSTLNSSSDSLNHQSTPSLPFKNFELVIVLCGVGLLMVRAIVSAQVPFNQLGLAFAISGAVLCWEQQAGTLAPIGALLLSVAWFVTVGSAWPALGVSCIILGLLWRQLHQTWKPIVVSGLILFGFQTYWLMQILLPEGGRSALFQTAIRITQAQISWEFMGLIFLVPIIATLTFSSYLNHKNQPQLAKIALNFAGMTGILCVLPGIFNPTIRSIYFLVSFIILGFGNFAIRRSNSHQVSRTNVNVGDIVSPDYPKRLVTLTQMTAIGWVLSVLDGQFKALGALESWAIVGVVGAIVEWGLVQRLRDRVWKKSAWVIGLGFAVMAWIVLLSLLWTEEGQQILMANPRWLWLWWVIPAALTIGARLKARSPQTMPVNSNQMSLTSTVMIFAGFCLTNGSVNDMIFNSTIAVVLMALNTQILRTLAAAATTIGILLLLIQAILTRSVFATTPWFGMVVLSLWVVHQGLNGRLLAHHQSNASNPNASNPNRANPNPSHHNQLIAHYSQALDGWAIGIVLVSFFTAIVLELLAWTNGIQLLDSLSNPFPIPFSRPFFSLLFDRYANGRILIDAAFIAVGMVVRGQNSGQQWVLLRLGMILEWGVSYLLSHAELELWARSWSAIDRLACFALLSIAIGWFMQALQVPIRKAFRLSQEDTKMLPDFHWTVAACIVSIVILFSFVSPLSVFGLWQLAGCLGLMSAYGFLRGRLHPNWLYGAVISFCIALEVVLSRFLPDVVLQVWGVAIATAVAFGLAVLPWRQLGWSLIGPIRNCAIALPGVVLILTAWMVNLPGLLLAGGFYAWLAINAQRFAFNYVSILLGIWASFRLIHFWNLTDPLWYVSILAAATVVIAESEPGLQGRSQRQNRHSMRCLAIGFMALTALVQAESSWALGLLTIMLGLLLVVVGLAMRTRAYLYVGTLLFIVQVLKQLFVFITAYSMLLWALGITVGLLLIWVAATFESRRSSTIALMQYWSAELDRWE